MPAKIPNQLLWGYLPCATISCHDFDVLFLTYHTPAPSVLSVLGPQLTYLADEEPTVVLHIGTGDASCSAATALFRRTLLPRTTKTHQELYDAR